jgi:hypothetical protein
MLKYFKVANVKPSTASPMLHQMEDRAYDPKSVSNIIAKAQKTWLSARVLVDYLIVSPETSCVFLLHDPGSPSNGGAKKGRPKKSSAMRVVTKDFNSQVIVTEMIPEMSAEQYAIA